MANGDIPRVTVAITSAHAISTEVVIPCKDAEQSDFIGKLVLDLVNAVRDAYISGAQEVA